MVASRQLPVSLRENQRTTKISQGSLCVCCSTHLVPSPCRPPVPLLSSSTCTRAMPLSHLPAQLYSPFCVYLLFPRIKAARALMWMPNWKLMTTALGLGSWPAWLLCQYKQYNRSSVHTGGACCTQQTQAPPSLQTKIESRCHVAFTSFYVMWSVAPMTRQTWVHHRRQRREIREALNED